MMLEVAPETQDRSRLGVRRVLRFVAACLLAGTIILNLTGFSESVNQLPNRDLDEIFLWENYLTPIRIALLTAQYRDGIVGYMPGNVLRGHPHTDRESIDWALVRFVMIPWRVVQDTIDAPFVIVDFRGQDPDIPAGFRTLYQSPEGLFLLKRSPSSR
jgi:hypothetical protein